jgi:hypothetical protein
MLIPILFPLQQRSCDAEKQLFTDFGRLVGEIASLRYAAAGIERLFEEVSALKTSIAQKLNDPVVEQLSTDASELHKEVSALKTQIPAMSPITTPSQNQLPPRLSLQQPLVSLFDSRIISGVPEILTEFRKKQFSLLWRGSCVSFSP